MAAKNASNSKHRTGGRKHTTHGNRRSPATRAAKEYGAIGRVRDEVSDYVSRGQSQVREMTRDHEGTTVLVALAAGFGTGLLIGGILAASSRRPKSWTERITAEGIGQRIMERIENMIPEALAERIGR